MADQLQLQRENQGLDKRPSIVVGEMLHQLRVVRMIFFRQIKIDQALGLRKLPALKTHQVSFRSAETIGQDRIAQPMELAKFLAQNLKDVLERALCRKFLDKADQ